jgi:hypothetical protein
VPFRDSIDKIVTVYFASLTKVAFDYKGRVYSPKPIRVSPLIFRDFTCPDQCGGCCPRFSLDYLPNEAIPYSVSERTIMIEDRRVKVLTDSQGTSSDHHCGNLDRVSGRCTIHGLHPFTCDFELLRFIVHQDIIHFNQKLFGRGWAMIRVDGGRGARCSMMPASSQTVPEIMRKLQRLQNWAEHFGIDTWVPQIMNWISSGPHAEALELPPQPGDCSVNSSAFPPSH